MADTSTANVFNYLDRPDLHVPAEVVSNNHFDEDGLVGIYRYESWVQMASRGPALRVDLTALAGESTREDAAGGRWRSRESSTSPRACTGRAVRRP